MFGTKEKIDTPRRSANKVPLRTGIIASRMLNAYMEGRARVVGMEETDKGLDPDAFGTGTILTFSENKIVTVPASVYSKLGLTPPAQEQVSHAIFPMVGVVAPARKSERAIIGFQATPRGLYYPKPIPKPSDQDYHYKITDEELDISTEVFFDDVRIAREVPIGGFGLRHYLDPSDLDKMSF